MRVEESMNLFYGELSENERYVCAYLSCHRDECISKSIDVFAAEAGVSKTLLVRFAKKLGMTGYSELKARLRLEREESRRAEAGLTDEVAKSCHRMMDGLVRRDLSGLFEKLRRADRVFVYGSGSAQARAASEMKRIFLPAREMVHVHGHDMCMALRKTAGPGDLVFLISLSGESEAVVGLAEALRIKQVPSVSITRLCGNSLASLCGENLYIHSIRMAAGGGVEYETATPYFILIEFLYLSYQNYLARNE